MVVVFISATWKGTTTTQERGPWLDSPFSFLLQCIPFWVMNPGWWALHVWLVPWIFLFWSGPCERDTQIWAGHGIWAMQSILYPFRPSSPRVAMAIAWAIEKERKTVQTALVVYVTIYILFIDFLGYRVCFRLPFFLENLYDRGHFEMKTRAKMRLRLFCSKVLRPCPNLIYISRLINSVNV